MGVGGDFEEFVLFIGEMKEDGVGASWVAAPADAGEDFAARGLGIAGVSGQHIQGAVDGVAAGEDAVLMVKSVREPLAEAVRENGPAEMAVVAVGDDDPGVA